MLGLHPDRWGWRQRGDKLEAITTDQAAAPTYLLEIIRCHCKTDCVSTNCSCKKHGLKCSPACKECRGQSCVNSLKPDVDDNIYEENKVCVSQLDMNSFTIRVCV